VQTTEERAGQALKRKYGLSDRIRYYWVQPEVQVAIEGLIRNLGERHLPYSLLSQFVGRTNLSAVEVIEWKVSRILKDHWIACNN
jgi:D-tagatose-1,6-bisphosphate aldolase subunit GatZ/KbaZ